MRGSVKLLACALLSAFAYAGSAQADGLANKTPWAVRQQTGPVDKALGGGEKPKADNSASSKSGPPANQNVVSGEAPPAVPQAVEEAAPTTPVETRELNADGSAKPQSIAGDGTPLWQNRWLWGLLALLLIAAAIAVEYFGRKRDEELAADEPDDAPVKA